MKSLSKRTSLIGAGIGLAILATAGTLVATSNNRAKADSAAAATPPAFLSLSPAH